MMKRFAIIGHCGYIAPRHINAIHNIQGTLVACYDLKKIDKPEYIQDKYEEFNNYDDFLNFLKTANADPNNKIDYVSICSPNHLHYQHMKDSLLFGSNVICEKPLVGSLEELDDLKNVEKLSGKKIFTILQLRYHDAIDKLKDYLIRNSDSQFKIDLIYIAGRDKAYLDSWKGDSKKSFGIGANIGIHFFDMLHYVFGPTTNTLLKYYDEIRAAGVISFSNAEANWFLSIDVNDIPQGVESTTFRRINVNDFEVDFSSQDGFKDLHTISYSKILEGKGFTISDAEPSLKMALYIDKKNLKK